MQMEEVHLGLKYDNLKKGVDNEITTRRWMALVAYELYRRLSSSFVLFYLLLLFYVFLRALLLVLPPFRRSLTVLCYQAVWMDVRQSVHTYVCTSHTQKSRGTQIDLEALISADMYVLTK